MDVVEIQRRVREFTAERGWDKYHSPKNLTTALMVEAAELAEIFQWITSEDSYNAGENPDYRERVADELADVCVYLLRVSDVLGIDLEEAIMHKLEKNAMKYPTNQQHEWKIGD